jgi:hypothetical protein
VTAMPPMSPIATIRLHGPNTFHNGEALSLVADSEAAVRGMAGVVTIEHAKSLVARGEAVWLKPPPEIATRQGVTT